MVQFILTVILSVKNLVNQNEHVPRPVQPGLPGPQPQPAGGSGGGALPGALQVRGSRPHTPGLTAHP